MTTQQSWNYIVQQYNKNRTALESSVQSDWENYFADSELFGYSRIQGDVDSHRKLHIGSSDREIPDIILRKNNKDLFIVELKQYSLSKNADFEKQLLNYMAHTDLRVSVGVLICNKIYLYFYNVAENSKISLEIPFTPDNSDGIKFVELFSKENFDVEKVRNFIKERNKSAKNRKLVQDELTPDLIHTLLKNHFSQKNLENEFEEIWKNYDVKIEAKSSKQETPQVNFTRNSNFQNNHLFKKQNISKISKQDAILLARQNGLDISGACTFASENSGASNFWANPNVNLLTTNWWLICNDISNRKLYVFFIPANSLCERDVVLRSDKSNLIDLQIKYSDPNFQDSRSKVSFLKWLKKTIDY